MYDAIIVGARCAGSATAMLLARRGLRVLMLDRGRFPSETISGHFIMHPGTRKLAEWGLLDRVIASGAPPITRASFNCGDFTLSAPLAPDDGLPACIGPRRMVLDQLLVEAAIEAGAEFRAESSVRDLLWADQQVVGVRFRTPAGEERTERATLVIGADGRHSLIARLVDAARYREVAPITCWYMGYWADLRVDGFEAHWLNDRLALALPTNDGLSLVAVGWPHASFRTVREDVDGHYRATVGAMPALAERFSDAILAGPYTGMADLANFFRRPCGPGWALVGDAGHFKDPTTARGISDAFIDAELVADAVAAAHSGGISLEASLAAYQLRRDARAIPESEFNMERATLANWGTPPQLALRAALRNNPVDTQAFMHAAMGITPREQFFTAENIGRVMAAARATSVAS